MVHKTIKLLFTVYLQMKKSFLKLYTAVSSLKEYARKVRYIGVQKRPCQIHVMFHLQRTFIRVMYKSILVKCVCFFLKISWFSLSVLARRLLKVMYKSILVKSTRKFLCLHPVILIN